MSPEALSKIACGLSQSHLVDWHGYCIHRDIVKPLNALILGAKKSGFDITLASSYRDFSRQMLIWNNKFSGKRDVLDSNSKPVDLNALSELEKCEAIMLYSAIPGGSRHHFGTDIDIYSQNMLPSDAKLQLEPWEYQQGGPFYELSCWLDENLEVFGFFRPYASYKGGVAQEPWHISHYKTASVLEAHQSPASILMALQNSQVMGKETLCENIEVLHSNYIANISEPNKMLG